MIIITAPVHPVFIETLEQKGFTYRYVPACNYEELRNLIHEANGLVVSTNITIDKTLIDIGKSLKWIARLGSGMEHIDVAYAQTKSIVCVSSPEGNSNAVAEHALGLLIALMRNIHKSAQEVKSHLWIREENRGQEISGKTIGIIGYGNTGSRFAKLLSSFDARILVYDKYKTDIKDAYVAEADLPTLLETSDIISFHVPLNEETRYMANSSFFANLHQQPILINTSRGGVIDTNALIEALTQKRISGAVLDVLENERPSTFSVKEREQYNFLTHQSNVIITPHIAGYSQQSWYKLSQILLEKLQIL
jgi:D-3-phosphoglycerate dehydrogenase